MSLFQQDEERPDWPHEFDEPVSKLGQPIGVYRTSRRRAVIKGFTGLGLLLIGVAVNWIYWSWIGWVIPDKFLFILLFGPPIMGMYLLYAAWRDQGLWVLAYPTGLLRWQRGEIVSFPWADIERLTLQRVNKVDAIQGTSNADGTPLTAWLPLEDAGSRFLGSQIELMRGDGVSETFPSSLEGYEGLSRSIQEETFRALWPPLWDQYKEAEGITFGDITITWAGIHKGTDLLPWFEFSDVKIANGKLIIARHGKWRPFAEAPIAVVPNPHLLFTLLTVGRPMVSLADDKPDEEPVEEDV